jgi:purine-nucleoside phosphorylase
MPAHFELADYDNAADYVRAQTDRSGLPLSEQRPIGLVLGSGLNPLAESIEDAIAIPFEGIPHFPASTVVGHEGRLIVGQLAGQAVMAMQGRIHLYEGYTAAEITFPIRMMRRLGVETLILTNAAGGLNAAFHAGDLMLIVDHINFVGMAGHNPLIGPNIESFGLRFPSMTETYAPPLRQLALETARDLNITLRQGVYAYVAGPNFETPAEVRFLRLVGGDAMGMSTVPEALVGVHAGMQVLGISTITNMAVDQLDTDLETNHEEVLETGKKVVPQLTRLLTGVLERL